jgi:hypothetical protein
MTKYNDVSTNDLIARHAKLADEIMGLEYGDDHLFTNLNGNLPRYRAMQDEKSEIRLVLEERGVA